MKRFFLASLMGLLIGQLAFGASSDVKSQIGVQDLKLDDDGAAHGTFQRRTSTGGLLTLDKIDGNQIPWSLDYSRTIRPGGITGNSSSPGRIQNYNFGSASYTDNGYFADIIVGGPWVDVRKHGTGLSTTNGTDNWTTAIQTAIDNGIKEVRVPDGIFSISGINITGKNGFKFVCNPKAEIRWAGADNVPMLLVKNSEKVIVEGCWFNNTTANQPSSCIESNITAATIPSNVNGVTGNIFKFNTFGGTGSNSIRRGIHYTYTGTDQNNDQGLFVGNEARNYSIAAAELDGTMSTAHDFIGNRFVGAGPIGVKITGDQAVTGGGFRWWGGTMLAHTTADFVLGTHLYPVSIYGVLSENSNKFLTVYNPSGPPVTIIGIDYSDAQLNADNNAIDAGSCGTLTIRGSRFGGFSGTSKFPRVNLRANGSCPNGQWLVSEGNHWFVVKASISSPFVIGDTSTGYLISIGDTMTKTDQQTYPLPTVISGLTGLSGAIKTANNLRGTLTVDNAATTGSVTFTTAEPDATYYLNITPTDNTGAVAAGSNRVSKIAKTSAGFTITVEVAPGAATTQRFDWILVR